MSLLASICCFIIFLTSSASAQKIELGAGLGGFNYKGDIAPHLRLRFFKPGGSLFFRYNPNSALSLRAEIAGGLIGADDAVSNDPFQQARNMSFRTRIIEGSAVAEYNFLDYKDRRFAVNWTPYVFGGIGINSFKPNIVTSEYKTSGLVLPYGVGIKYQFKRPWNLGIEYGARKTFTDYLDNLGGDPISTDKLVQGDPSTKDSYYFLKLSVTYTFYRIFCP
ncbi:type IX secretion system protein PorG [Dyadobacter luteus]|uniref:type IX secretion system protein PorG n=1 Tax=Dyadobacter luteus TaxID=2259619 RepID=UPI0021D0B92C|nr:porin family protein [Dyadobacter luteus]